jgi:beta-lactamase superfamily II metal-dependent hydrolase
MIGSPKLSLCFQKGYLNMDDQFKFPDKKAVIFWPIGTGDSATLVLKPGKIIMQIDLRHLEKADDPEEPERPILDKLVEALPKRKGRPYLGLFALTHPDKDHIQEFRGLIKKIDVRSEGTL